MKRKPQKTWAERVKAVRAALHLSQEKLARELDVSFCTVNRWENGTHGEWFRPCGCYSKFLDLEVKAIAIAPGRAGDSYSARSRAIGRSR